MKNEVVDFFLEGTICDLQINLFIKNDILFTRKPEKMSEASKRIAIPDEVVLSKIFLIRNIKVMIDRDLADLFDVKAIRLREQVKRNIGKFPLHFMFQLTNEEVENMVSQNAIPSKQHLGGALPYVFTEYGVLQLANVLKSTRATQMSIKIIEVFIKMREILSTHKEILQKLEWIEKKDIEQDDKIMLIFEYLRQLEETKQEEFEYKNRSRIGFNLSKEK
jgi:hypothetical protein